MDELVQTLGQFFVLLGSLLRQFGQTWALRIVLLTAWVAFWLSAVNWKRVWPVLAQGAWLPMVLLLLISALVWSQIDPGECSCLRFVTIPNFWWQLGEVGLLAASALFLGWLQGVFHWTPTEVSLDPPPPADHGHHASH